MKTFQKLLKPMHLQNIVGTVHIKTKKYEYLKVCMHTHLKHEFLKYKICICILGICC